MEFFWRIYAKSHPLTACFRQDFGKGCEMRVDAPKFFQTKTAAPLSAAAGMTNIE